jgi:hypothetical protein
VQHLRHAPAGSGRAHVPQPPTAEGATGVFGGFLEASGALWAQQSPQTADGTWWHDDLSGIRHTAQYAPRRSAYNVCLSRFFRHLKTPDSGCSPPDMDVAEPASQSLRRSGQYDPSL